jgi:hypothetical protein
MIVRELESHVVPSVMVLVLGNDSSLSRVADAVVAGAKRVRFTEVTVRAVEPDVFRYQRLADETSFASHDGVVVVAPDDASAAGALEAIGGMRPLTDTVVARVGGDSALSAALVETGGVVVSAPADSSREDHARAVGERVARVAGWVRHSLSHETEDHHHHDHDHHHGHEHHHTRDQR